MKKQFLILMLALFALSVSNSYGQAVPGSSPRPLPTDCATGPLSPIAGVPYTYGADVTPPGGTAVWYATTSTTFMEDGNRVATPLTVGSGNPIAAAANYLVNDSPVINPTETSITWTSSALAAVDNINNFLFVVVEYTAAAADCSNNMKVYRINPVNAFTVNVKNLNTVYGVDDPQCYAPVKGAVFNPGTLDMTMDYGSNTLLFEIVAANFTESWTPTFALNGLSGAQRADVFWSYTSDFAIENSLGTNLGNGTINGQEVTTSITDTSNGVSIFVKVVVHNNTYEGISNDPITLYAMGLNAADESNIDNFSASPSCTVNITDIADADSAYQTLEARPAVDENPAPPDMQFVPRTN